MSDWQPIETAPTDTRVRLGKWKKSYLSSDSLEWVTETGIAWESAWFGRRVRPIYEKDWTHWQALPEPPEDKA